MNFLAPLFLWAVPAALAPVIFHLIQRRPPRPLNFSYLKWLQAVHHSTMPKKNLRDLLLLVLRVLILLCLILGFSRPVASSRALNHMHSDASAVVLLMDTSASMGIQMGGQTGLAVSVSRCEEFIRKMPAETKIGFIAYSSLVESELTPSGDRAFLLSQLKSLKVQSRPTDITPALVQAYRMLANQPAGSKSILVVSDQAEHGYAGILNFSKPIDGFDPTVSLVLWESVENTPNAGIDAAGFNLTADGHLVGSWMPYRSGGSGGPLLWKLTLNQKVAAQGTSENSSPVSINVPLPEGGTYAGQISLQPDALGFDDTFFVAGRVPKGFRLLLVDGESGLAPADSEVYYVRTALESSRDARLQSLTTVRPESLTAASWDNVDVVVLANVGPLPEDISNSLKSWVEKGGGLFLSAGSQWSRANGDPMSFFHVNSGVHEKRSIQKLGADAGLLSQMSGLADFDWSETEVADYFHIEKEREIRTLLSLDNGDPLLVEKNVGKGTAMAWLTTLDRKSTNFPVKPAFAPLMREIISSLADPNRSSSSLNFNAGDSVAIKLSLQGSCTVLNPLGQSLSGRVDDAGVFHWTDTQVPGLYRISTGRGDSDVVFSVNVKNRKEEGNLDRVPWSKLKSNFPGAQLTWVSSGENSSSQVISILQGRPLTSFFFILALLFFILESVLSSQRSNFVFSKKPVAALLALLIFSVSPVAAGTGNQFVWTQLSHSGLWDPYPDTSASIINLVKSMTNIDPVTERRVVTLSDSQLFESSFLCVKGSEKLKFSADDKKHLKRFIDGGGFVLFDDTLASPHSPFSDSVRTLLSELYPDRSLERLPQEHAVFRSFFLLRSVGGRRVSQKFLEGLNIGGQGGGEGRTAAILSSNDILGAWAKDPTGTFLETCIPGGEAQRSDAFKLTVNLIYFSLTGTYKKDAIHQPFIEKKMGT